MKTNQTQHSKHTQPVKYNAYGCTIATGDNWLDGRNYGGNFVATTFDPELADTVPTDEAIDRATSIADRLNSHQAMVDALQDCIAQIDHLVNHLSEPNQRFTEPTTTACVNAARAALKLAQGETR